jgi:uroporphyrinogen decarboxylase
MPIQEIIPSGSNLTGRPPTKQRFITALKGGQPDYVPLFEFPCSQNLCEYLLGHRPQYYEAADVIQLSLELSLDGAFIPYGGFKGYTARVDKKIDEQTYIDEWGTTYKDTGASWPVAAPVVYPVRTKQDLQRYKSPDPTLSNRLDGIRQAKEMSQDRVAVMGGINGPLTVAHMLSGLDILMVSIHEDPSFVDDLLKVGYEYYYEACKQMIADGVDAICIAEDMGYSASLFMSPNSYRRHLFPLLESLIHLIHDAGVPVFLHCDGNINKILDDLVELGIDGLHPIERKSNMDIVAIKKKYGDRLCLIGNVDSTVALCSGTPDDVRAQVFQLLEQVAPAGGFILASDSDLRDDMPIENIQAMFDTGRVFGKYPISLPHG